jgi:hypothetical protein
MVDTATPWQRILLATEHTEFDAGAERLAIALAQRSGEPLGVVVPAIVNPELIAEAPGLAERADAAAAARRQELLRIAAAAGVPVEVRVREGDEAQAAIVEHARETRADLIVIRRVGHRGLLSRLLVGEMAGAVASRAHCDVLMVPRDGEPWRRAVLAAVDASASGLRAAASAARVARSMGLPVFVVSVAAEASQASRAQAEAAARAAIDALARTRMPAESAVRTGKPPAEIVAAAAERGADLIVVGRRGASGSLHRALLGSTAQKVVGMAACPVLVVGD